MFCRDFSAHHLALVSVLTCTESEEETLQRPSVCLSSSASHNNPPTTKFLLPSVFNPETWFLEVLTTNTLNAERTKEAG